MEQIEIVPILSRLGVFLVPTEMKKLAQLLEHLIKRKGSSYILCKICGGFRKIKVQSDNLREDGLCEKCHSNSRKRHLAVVLLDSLQEKGITGKLHSLQELPTNLETSVYNVECNGALHEYLKVLGNYSCSEYFGPYKDFGTVHNGILNIDLRDIPFQDNRFDYVISTEVFEHIPDPYSGFREIHRILKKGGAHIFTVPFCGRDHDEIRAVINENDEIVHLMEPQFHGDPVRADEGILVYTIFSSEMFARLSAMGFRVQTSSRRNALYGILGPGNLVFTATKI